MDVCKARDSHGGTPGTTCPQCGAATPIAESSPSEKRPPRVPLALRIGVTGHRPEPPPREADEPRKRPLPDIPAIRETLRLVLGVIHDAFQGVAETSGNLFDLKPSKENPSACGSLRVVSALAAGADQWVEQEARRYGFELQAILPFDRDEYRLDFAPGADRDGYDDLLRQASAVLELDGTVDRDDRGNRNPDSQSYEAVGRVVLNQTDILIAVWDGKPPHGRGGTGQIAGEALQRGIPVVWVPWNTPQDWRLQRPVWRLLEHPDDAMDDQRRLTEMVRELLLPPLEEIGPDAVSGEGLLHEYLGETQKRCNPQHGVWLVFRNLVCCEFAFKKGLRNARDAFCVGDFEERAKTAATEDWVKRKSPTNTELVHQVGESMRRWVDERFVKHYAWANGLSVYYGNLYRGVFVTNYFLGAIAVLLALVCVAQGITGRAQTPWIVAELLVIVAILMLTHAGRQWRWHQRWIDYRTLAERLRLARCLSLFGGGGPRVVFAGHLAGYGNPARTWMHWYYRATERAAGVPPVRFTSAYLLSCQEFWRESLLQDQRDYHHATADRFARLDHCLHHAGDGLFIATLIACVMHAAHLWIGDQPRFDWIPRHLPGWLTLACAVMPALGAAFAAIRSQCEAQRLAQRSRAMEETLTQLQLDLASVSTSDKALNSQRLRDCADRVSDLMIRETLDWRVVFQDQPLKLP